jgi:hypothetical protein
LRSTTGMLAGGVALHSGVKRQYQKPSPCFTSTAMAAFARSSGVDQAKPVEDFEPAGLR